MAAIDGNNNLRLWDVQTGRQIASPLKGHSGKVEGLAFSRDGRRLASAGVDNTVRLWDADNAASLGEPLRGGEESSLTSVAFSPDGNTIAAGGLGVLVNNEAPLWIWNADSGAAIGKQAPGTFKEAPGPFKGFLSVAFSADGNQIVTGGMDSTVRLWNARTGEPIGDPVNLQTLVYRVAFTARDNRVVSVSPETVQVSRTDPQSSLAVEMNGSKVAEDHGGYGLVSTKDGPRVVVSSKDTEAEPTTTPALTA